MYRLEPISPECTHSNNTNSLQQQIQVKRCTYRTFMRNDKKWRTLQILIVLFAVVSVLVHLAWFHLKWPKVPIMVDSSQWTHSHVRTDMFDVTKWVKETWKLLGITLRSPGLSCQCSQSQPTTRQTTTPHSGLCTGSSSRGWWVQFPATGNFTMKKVCNQHMQLLFHHSL